jgi:hypothetical protein
MPQKKAPSKKAPTKKPRASSSGSSRGVGVAKDLAIRLTAAEKRRMEQENAVWQAQDDLRILRASQEITADSARMERAQALIDQEMKALQSVKSVKRG